MALAKSSDVWPPTAITLGVMSSASIGGTLWVQRWQKVLLAVLVLIVFTGAAVRLTDSGLGCEDWPGCSEDSFVPEADFHGIIEFGNRLLSGFVLIASLIATALIVTKRRLVKQAFNYAKLRNLNIAILLGVITQALVGLLTVRSVLDPRIVGIHFLLSIILIDLGVRAVKEFSLIDLSAQLQPRLAGVVKTLLAVAIFLGVVVTGSGPNSGDTRASRLGFDLEEVTRVHSVSVWLLIAASLWAIYRNKDRLQARQSLLNFAGLLVIQGAIGYTQFAIGVPPGLVLAHVVLATLIWTYMSWISIPSPTVTETSIDLRNQSNSRDTPIPFSDISR